MLIVHRVGKTTPKTDGVRMAFVNAQPASDAKCLVDYMAFAVVPTDGFDRTHSWAHPATVAFTVNIRLGSGPGHVDKAGGRTFVCGRHESLASVIVKHRKIVFHRDGTGGCCLDTLRTRGAPNRAVKFDP